MAFLAREIGAREMNRKMGEFTKNARVRYCATATHSGSVLED